MLSRKPPSHALLLQKAKYGLRQLIGLGQNGSTSLLQDLIFGQFRGFCSKVSVTNPTTGS